MPQSPLELGNMVLAWNHMAQFSKTLSFDYLQKKFEIIFKDERVLNLQTMNVIPFEIRNLTSERLELDMFLNHAEMQDILILKVSQKVMT